MWIVSSLSDLEVNELIEEEREERMVAKSYVGVVLYRVGGCWN